MGVQNAADILVANHLRQLALQRPLDLALAFAQLGRNERQPERCIDILLLLRSNEPARQLIPEHYLWIPPMRQTEGRGPAHAPANKCLSLDTASVAAAKWAVACDARTAFRCELGMESWRLASAIPAFAVLFDGR
jgi:hypothetical protein